MTERAGANKGRYTPVNPDSDLVQAAQQEARSKSLGKWPLAWLWVLLTTIFLLLTLLHCSQLPIKSRMHILYSSSSKNIFILSVLSGLTGVFLAASIAASLENIKWTLISRNSGLRLSRFLALQPSTGVVGLLHLALGWHLPWASTTRVWSWIRLIALVLVPGLGILIMSDINTRPVFDVVNESPPSFGWGMSAFDGSLANNVSIITDQLIQAELSRFLSEPSRAVDITPMGERLVSCSHVPGVPNTENCHRVYFVPGGVELAMPAVAPTSNSSAEAYLAQNQQGCIFDFVEGPGVNETWSWHIDTECVPYGFGFGAFLLCLKNSGNNSNILRAMIIPCPYNVSTASQCLTDTDWWNNPGWTTQLTATFQRANVAYTPTNGSILWQDFIGSPSPAPVPAHGILAGFASAFQNFSDPLALSSLLLDPSKTSLFALYAYPAVVWANLKGVAVLGPTDPALLVRAQDTLQCLLAILLYYSQPSMFARALSTRTNLTSDQQDLKNSLPVADTEVRKATMRFQLIMDKSRLTTYATLCGTAILLCVVGLVFSFIVGHIPEGTAFPGWDERVKCVVHREDGGDESAGNGTGKFVAIAERSKVLLNG
jgi:hypothetical protein